ncbi:hypothetical protein CP02DC23_1123A, partial [Chlamydia psittaci 02DC23]
MVLFE